MNKRSTNLNASPENTWWSVFGFQENPYATGPLSGESDSTLLVGRRAETEWLKRKIREAAFNSRIIPVLCGDHGVGKTSLINVVAHEMKNEFNSGKERYFVLEPPHKELIEVNGLENFEREVYDHVIDLLLENKDFLSQRNIPLSEITKVSKFSKTLVHSNATLGITPISAGYGYSSNPSADRQIPNIARTWLKKCFGGEFRGGIICVIDNLELLGSSSNVQKVLEQCRDKLFAVPGLIWILCGTTAALTDVLNSQMLSGYLDAQLIEPFYLGDDPALSVVKSRIDLYGKGDVCLPVDEEGFKNIYSIENKQLRNSLNICRQFAEFLYDNPVCMSLNRSDELYYWINQRAAEFPKEAYRIPNHAWELFRGIAQYGSIIDSDYKLVTTKSEKEFHETIMLLSNKGLLSRKAIQGGNIIRVTQNGWLVNYWRSNLDNYGLKTSPGSRKRAVDIKIDVNSIIRTMKEGGLCILPSDSSFTLTGYVDGLDVSHDINAILERGNLPMALAFGNLKQIADALSLSNMAFSFIDYLVNKLNRRGFTFVARPTNNNYYKLSKEFLYVEDGTIGVRLTDSAIETKIAEICPIPSTPIRDENNKEVGTAEEARRIVETRMAQKGIHREVRVIDGQVLHHRRLSTVVKEINCNGLWWIKIIRKNEDAIPVEIIKEVAVKCGYRGLIDE